MKLVVLVMLLSVVSSCTSCQKKEKVKEVACDVVELGSDLRDLLVTSTEDVYGPIRA